MGRYPGERSSNFSDEDPQHLVTIAYDFYLGQTEVTQRQWLALMGSWPGSAPNSDFGVGDDYPAYHVSWNDCQNFIAALNAHIDGGDQGPATFRLPRESEWEYACRAGTQTRFSFGDSDCSSTECSSCELDDYGWWCGNAHRQTHQVRQKLPNAWGLYDMHGNVFEWCEDNWHNSYDYASRPDDGSPWLDPTKSERVFRGGFWEISANTCHSAFRGGTHPGSRFGPWGLRLIRTQAPPNDNRTKRSWRMYE